MAYKIRALGTVRKDLKRLEEALQEEIRCRHFPKIREDPFQADPLSGVFRGLRSYKNEKPPLATGAPECLREFSARKITPARARRDNGCVRGRGSQSLQEE